MSPADAQGEIWGLRVNDWAELQEPFLRPLYVSALDTAGVGPGTKLLDAACGSGLALALADELGAEVHGFDASEAMLGVARERVRGADLRRGDIMQLPFEDGTFDVTTCFNGVQFADDHLHAVGELRRVTKPGGHVVVAVWGDWESSDMRHVFEALAGLLPPDEDAPPLNELGPFVLSAPGKLEQLIEDAGMRPELRPHVTVHFHYPDLETALRGLLSAGPLAAAAEALGEDTLREALVPVLGRFARDDDSYRMSNEFRYALGHT
jgi:SAM-dependent methyltransferase